MARKIVSWWFSFMLLVTVYVKIAQFRSPKFKSAFGNGGGLISKRLLGIIFLTSNFQVILKLKCREKICFSAAGP